MGRYGRAARAYIVTLIFLVPVKTTNPANMSRGNSRIVAILRAKTDAQHRAAGRLCTLAAMLRARVRADELVPCIVTLTRISAGKLDRHDGLPGSQKRVVDGIADALGIDDGGPFVEWKYDQVSAGRGVFGTRVLIEPRIVGEFNRAGVSR